MKITIEAKTLTAASEAANEIAKLMEGLGYLNNRFDAGRNEEGRTVEMTFLERDRDK